MIMEGLGEKITEIQAYNDKEEEERKKLYVT